MTSGESWLGGQRPSDEGLFGPGETTGSYLVVLAEPESAAGVKLLKEAAGIEAAVAAEWDEAAIEAAPLEERSVVFDQLGVAVITADPDQMTALGAQADQEAILAVEPERVVHALESLAPASPTPAFPGGGLSPEYLRGYRDAIDALLGAAVPMPRAEGMTPTQALDETQATWGLQVTKATASQFTGRDVRIAVLDTGLDLTHVDFVGRGVSTQSFVPDEEVQDGHGHGTHCSGTACGSARPSQFPRYGVASDADLWVGKVLNNRGRGVDRGILAGINWAVTNRCRVVSMSLGSPTRAGQAFSLAFEQAARRAAERGTLIVAAAGNESQRSVGLINPVAHPANCPSILAVAAVDRSFAPAPFSNRGVDPNGGQVDIAAPGVDVYSSWPMPEGYRRLSGTSMATPHVAGIVALFAQAQPDASPNELAALLSRTAWRLPVPATDVGCGLIQAPAATRAA
jgi:subtilisin family serine protease